MNNAALQAIITEYGDRLFCINFDNGLVNLVGYAEGSSDMTDMTLRTIGGVDFVAIKRTITQGMKDVSYEILHTTETIQWIGVMSAADKDYRIDPVLLK